MTQKAQIMDSIAVSRAMARITHEIIERNQGLSDLCLLGIKSRGVPLAQMLCQNFEKFFNTSVPYSVLDVTHHRDDMTAEDKASIPKSDIPFEIKDRTVIIVDDVLYTGRTARAAMEAVFAFGRPKSVQLVVLVDRGHRELPIRPDYIGKNVPTSQEELVRFDYDENEIRGVFICDKNK